MNTPPIGRWKQVRLGDVCRVLPGYAFSSRDWTAEGIPVIKIKNIREDRTIDTSEVDCVPETILTPKLKKFVLRDGDILVAMTGATAGKIGRLRTRKSFLLNQRVARLDPLSINYAFFWSIVSSPAYQQRFFLLADGAAQPNMSGSQIENVEIPLPPLLEQRKVAAILSSYDNLIENNMRRIRILEEMAQAIYREWFVHFRFPGHKKAKLVPSPLGPIPLGWSVAKLAEMADVNALSIQRGEEPEQIAYVDIASVSPGSIDEAKRIKFADAPGRARRIVRHGDIIWSMVRPNRRSFALILDPEPNLIASTGFAVVSATGVPSSYLYHALTTDEFVGYLANRATGAAYPAVKAEDFENAEILRPDETTLDRFDSSVLPILEMRNGLAKKNRNLRQSRDLLLPKLVSGELDVSDLDINVGDAAA